MLVTLEENHGNRKYTSIDIFVYVVSIIVLRHAHPTIDLHCAYESVANGIRVYSSHYTLLYSV